MSDNPIIPLVTDEAATPEVEAVFKRFRDAIGFVPNLVRMWAQAPHLLDTLVELETTLAGTGKIAPELKELAMARTSELNGCPYCKAFHGERLKELKIDTSKVDALTTSTPVGGGLFSEEELVVLQLADEMTLRVRAQPETIARAQRLFGLDGLVELMAVIGLLNFDNRMAYSAGVPVDSR
jgi:uncharacterized peroxidase-related enzyme